MNRER